MLGGGDKVRVELRCRFGILFMNQFLWGLEHLLPIVLHIKIKICVQFFSQICC